VSSSTPAPFEAELSERGSFSWGSLRGELDLVTAPLLKDTLDRALAMPRPVAVDVSELAFMDSSGLGVCVRAIAAATARGNRVFFVGRDSQGAHAFRLSGLVDRVNWLQPGSDPLEHPPDGRP
jgi:anti-anti-sigma factor